jgi:hypothetical protein
VDVAPRPENGLAVDLFPEKRLFDCVVEAPRPLPPKKELLLEAMAGTSIQRAVNDTMKAEWC